MSDLIERLMLVREYHCMMYEQYDTVTEAAATIAQLQAELAEAREVPGRIVDWLNSRPETMHHDDIATTIEARDWSKP